MPTHSFTYDCRDDGRSNVKDLNETSHSAMKAVWYNPDRDYEYYKQVYQIGAFEVFGREEEGRGAQKFITLDIKDTTGSFDGRKISIAKDGSVGWEHWIKPGEGWVTAHLKTAYIRELLGLVEKLKTDPAFLYTDTTKPVQQNSALVQLCARPDAMGAQPIVQ